eukprot:755416-Pyramimonas_sp.AAC.1
MRRLFYGQLDKPDPRAKAKPTKAGKVGDGPAGAEHGPPPPAPGGAGGEGGPASVARATGGKPQLPQRLYPAGKQLTDAESK